MLRKTQKAKENFEHTHARNILRLFNGWTNFSFTTIETKRDY